MADAAQEYITAFRGRMIEADVAREDEIIGCTEEEMAQILAINPDVAVPEVYLAFMREMGRSMGNLFAGSDLGYPDCVDDQSYFREYAADDDPTLRPDQWFIFGSHQGYQFYYFRDHDPRVYLHCEGRPNPFQTWESFADLLEGNLKDEIRLAHRRRYGDLSN